MLTTRIHAARGTLALLAFSGLCALWTGAHAQAPAAGPPPERCDNPKDCLNKGARALMAKDFVRAARFMPSACDIEPKACYNAAGFYKDGQGVPKNGAKAAEFYQRACAGKIIEACAIEAQMRMNGEDGCPVDKARARAAFELSCGPDFLFSCANAGLLFATGQGGEADKAKARTYYDKACAAGKGEIVGCVNLGALYLNGEGGDVDKAKAQELFTLACSAKNAEGCFNLGLIFAKGMDGGSPDLDKALGFLKQACELGNKQGCDVSKQIEEDKAKQKEAADAAAAKAAKKGGKKK